jgi:hypothetical protein
MERSSPLGDLLRICLAERVKQSTPTGKMVLHKTNAFRPRRSLLRRSLYQSIARRKKGRHCEGAPAPEAIQEVSGTVPGSLRRTAPRDDELLFH